MMIRVLFVNVQIHIRSEKNCEYFLPIANDTFEATLDWELQVQHSYEDYAQYYSDILCYTTLVCDSGRLCLDWRDICDGIQQCIYGYDEEVCDLLEFNECEDGEYRCMNGMCIPEEYFLDGDYDCMDLTDEKQSFKDTNCAYQRANIACDDRVCLPYQWSCGDGQCVESRFAFRKVAFGQHSCISRRDQFYMCEINFFERQWTLHNGKCVRSRESIGWNNQNMDSLEKCLYYFKCQLTGGLEKQCPCDDISSCSKYLISYSPTVFNYPIDQVVTSYITSIYSNIHNHYVKNPNIFLIHGIIKCRRFLIERSIRISYQEQLDLRHLESELCNYSSFGHMLIDAGYDRDCYRDSLTWTHRPYYFVDVCQYSKECISAYRIKDGIRNCADGKDEEQNPVKVIQSCSPIKKHRFRCSIDEPTCLFVNKLGDGKVDCQNKHDESLLETNLPLSETICNDQSTKDCKFLRQYIEKSWEINSSSNIVNDLNTVKISFRQFCDTFYDLRSKKDEDLNTCKKWWTCREEQWQCHTGQCIDVAWVLDDEWDCSDASDEDAIFFYNHTFSTRNLNLITMSVLQKRFSILYKTQAFSGICNLTKEYPCFRVGVTHPLFNITYDRPCINLEQIGDGYVDCTGALDERNTLQHCTDSTTLGRDFLCVSSGICIDEFDICTHLCPNSLDNHVLCSHNMSLSYCSQPQETQCIDGQCAVVLKCDDNKDCLYGEDEYNCERTERILINNNGYVYRIEKQKQVKNSKYKIQQSKLPVHPSSIERIDIFSSSVHNKSIPVHSFVPIQSLLPYACNRGVGVLLFSNTTICFCPPQYYGNKCQFHSDRLTMILRLNLSGSIYAEFNDPTIVLKLLVLFIFNNQTIIANEFHARPDIESTIEKKWIGYGIYSRSNESIIYKRKRYFNRSNIIHEHPYTVRIECYELLTNKKPQLIAVWQYPVYFDYLPSFRFSKVLRLHRPRNEIYHPCFSNPCTSLEECHPLENQRSTYVCLCRNNYTGTNCSTLNSLCVNNYCSPQALCKPTYRGILNGNERPLCICPLNTFGHRCELENDICFENPCQNNGSCYSGTKTNEFLCVCNADFYGRQCEENKQTIQLNFHDSIPHHGATVQYFILNSNTFDLILLYQRVFSILPQKVNDLISDIKVPEIILIRFYINKQIKIYLIVLQINATSINRTIYWYEQQQCSPAHSLWSISEELSPIKYHYLCSNMSVLGCFYDDDYLCVCMKEKVNETECFGYDHYLDQCSRCLANGLCLQDDPLKINSFFCLCPPCYYGSLCQFSSIVQSFSLYSLFVSIRIDKQLLYVTLAMIILIVGGINNYASFITFKRPNLYKSGVARYLLLSSLMSQCSLLTLFGVIILSVLPSFLSSNISCKILSYFLSTFTRCTCWFFSWITLERLFLVLFPFNQFLKKPILASMVIAITLVIVSSMHIHELFFYIRLEDPNKQILCVANFTQQWSTYIRFNLMAHYIIPFCIQIISITILIVLIARSRSRVKQKGTSKFIELLKQQFKEQKELYILPLIIIISSLPQVILSFIFSCTELSSWQRHTLLSMYLLSYAPQLLGFIIFVVPSENFSKEFQKTQLSKRCLFKMIYRKHT
ncbi:unnamed protein product [Adineta steineri]|uniref:Uncharacterized protein n=1 Tax=Adineta steineri TaxID=433720 RepID=A0A819ITH9_9BILA|nr:unnamed protein product [Adineta steineri]